MALVVTVLALFAPAAAAAAAGIRADSTPTRHTVAAHAGQRTAAEDAPAFTVAVAHRLDAHLPGPQPVGPPRTAADTAPHRATGGPDTQPAAPRARSHEAIDSAAPRGPPHR